MQNRLLELSDGLGGAFSAAVELIRAAKPGDLRGVVALWHRCDLVLPGHDPAEDFTSSLRETATIILVAVTPDDDVIGTSMAESEGRLGFLWYVAVHPAYRAEGIGRLLIEGCEQWLGEHGVTRVQLSLQSDEVGIVRFYQRIGYDVWRPRHMSKRIRMPFS